MSFIIKKQTGQAVKPAPLYVSCNLFYKLALLFLNALSSSILKILNTKCLSPSQPRNAAHRAIIPLGISGMEVADVKSTMRSSSWKLYRPVCLTFGFVFRKVGHIAKIYPMSLLKITFINLVDCIPIVNLIGLANGKI